jgi:hypothetical protein
LPEEKSKQGEKRKTFISDNIMSDGMLPPVSADELVNEQIKYMSLVQGKQEETDDHSSPLP